jgi:nucleotide-binding universal stress UspA family protein/CheY-like chemotaxis protein
MDPSLRIAVADDEPDMREYLQKLLVRLGHEVVAVAQNGRELLEQCIATIPDLVISDVKMPEMDGVAAALALLPVHPVPVILISARHDPSIQARADGHNILICLDKPVGQADLESAIASAVSRRAKELRTPARKSAMADSILVPLDGSSFGEHALPLALDLARRIGAVVKLALVHEPVILVEPFGGAVAFSNQLDAQLRQQETQYLCEAVARIRQVTSQPIEAELLDGPTVDALAGRMREKEVRWAVLTTHGRGPLSRFWLGNVADGLVRNAEIPLLLVRPESCPADLKCEFPIRSVLVCLDGSPLAETVLEPALKLASVLGAGVILLRVVKAVFFAGHDPTRAAPELLGQPLTDQLQQQAVAYLQQVAACLDAPSLKIEQRVVVAAQPAVAILEQSQEQPDTLTAMATHGRGGLVRTILGSVADKVLRGGTGPLLLYRPTKK